MQLLSQYLDRVLESTQSRIMSYTLRDTFSICGTDEKLKSKFNIDKIVHKIQAYLGIAHILAHPNKTFVMVASLSCNNSANRKYSILVSNSSS